MVLLLTILSVVAVWAFLTVLVLGLLLVLKGLQGVRAAMEKISMGVRAIEKQTEPLGSRADAVARRFGETSEALEGAAREMERLAPTLERMVPRLRRRTTPR